MVFLQALARPVDSVLIPLPPTQRRCHLSRPPPVPSTSQAEGVMASAAAMGLNTLRFFAFADGAELPHAVQVGAGAGGS